VALCIWIGLSLKNSKRILVAVEYDTAYLGFDRMIFFATFVLYR
jgi:hypothetical protein